MGTEYGVLRTLAWQVLLALVAAVALGVAACVFVILLINWASSQVTNAMDQAAFLSCGLLSLGVSTAAGARFMRLREASRHPLAGDGYPSPAGGLVTRRAFLKWLAMEATVGTMTAAGSAYILRVEPGWLEVERIDVPLPGLDPRLEGTRIVQLSDLHLSEIVPVEQVRQAVSLAQTLAGDLIVLTGDYITRYTRFALPCARELAALHAPGGVHAVLGNHDHWTDPELIANALRDSGISLLRNEARRVSINGADLWLVGLDDVWERKHDLASALRDVPAGATAVLLVHEPDFADQAAGNGIALQLSGHSHGGQVCIPGIGALIKPYLARKYTAGLQRAGDMWVYTNRGIGTVFPPVRLNCRPEVTLITLRAS
jgi:predicted MPP superfamily phosphohydrolase